MALTDHAQLKARLAALGIDTPTLVDEVVDTPSEETEPCRTDGKYQSLARNLNAEKRVTRDAVITIRVTKQLKSMAIKAAKPGKLAPYVENAIISALSASGYEYDSDQ
jgi:hypothetical protein